MELSIAGRFLVLSPHGEGSGVSRRLPDGERERLRELAKSLEADQGGHHRPHRGRRRDARRTSSATCASCDKMWAQVAGARRSRPRPGA